MQYAKTKMTLCWDCANACGNCSWSDRTFTPVSGWKAKPTIVKGDHRKNGDVKIEDSFHVEACPLFKDDTNQYSKRGY